MWINGDSASAYEDVACLVRLGCSAGASRRLAVSLVAKRDMM